MVKSGWHLRFFVTRGGQEDKFPNRREGDAPAELQSVFRRFGSAGASPSQETHVVARGSAGASPSRKRR